MIIIILLIVLLVSFSLHISYLLKYIRSRDNAFLWKFINTTVINVCVSGACIVIMIFMPEKIRRIDPSILSWAMSGVLMGLMMLFQSSVFIKVYRRAQMPENYHYNFFGKKILNPAVVKPIEVALFIVSIPFLLVSGAYFTAKIIRMFMVK
jgi:hypothetical protein